MKTLIKNARLVLQDHIEAGCVLLEDGKIRALTQGAADEVIDAGGAYLAPGFIDIHTHGAGGADFMDGTVEAYLTAARMHARHGTTLLFPTTLTSTNEALYASFATYEKARALSGRDGALLGGMHLEGSLAVGEGCIGMADGRDDAPPPELRGKSRRAAPLGGKAPAGDVGRTGENLKVLLRTGIPEFGDKAMKLGSGEVLVIEGIHGLNPKSTQDLSDEYKFKI